MEFVPVEGLVTQTNSLHILKAYAVPTLTVMTTVLRVPGGPEHQTRAHLHGRLRAGQSGQMRANAQSHVAKEYGRGKDFVVAPKRAIVKVNYNKTEIFISEL